MSGFTDAFTTGSGEVEGVVTADDEALESEPVSQDVMDMVEVCLV